MDLAVLAATFGAIFIVELPDKTFIAALVLSTRYRPLAVWLGVGLAFGVQTLVAVTVGTLATLLPEALIKSVAITIFLVGAVLLFRTAPGADAAEKEQEEEYAARAVEPKSFLRAAVASFLVLFAAEWGDLSQLLTISFVTRYDDHLNVFFGAWAALLTVSGLAVVAGRVLLRYLRLAVLHYIGAAVCLLLAVLTALQALGMELPV
jgi:putative Ca2+/H+ antiporter (TMEM165/GDT1 family)